mmetsp:Transcript_65826/g.171331  ORF Transcript_65826/g.171331 Transcript_65826/m.171331 type:complete len:290 (-) Transcript_65826:519-1388(-)
MSQHVGSHGTTLMRVPGAALHRRVIWCRLDTQRHRQPVLWRKCLQEPRERGRGHEVGSWHKLLSDAGEANELGVEEHLERHGLRGREGEVGALADLGQQVGRVATRVQRHAGAQLQQLPGPAHPRAAARVRGSVEALRAEREFPGLLHVQVGLQWISPLRLRAGVHRVVPAPGWAAVLGIHGLAADAWRLRHVLVPARVGEALRLLLPRVVLLLQRGTPVPMSGAQVVREAGRRAGAAPPDGAVKHDDHERSHPQSGCDHGVAVGVARELVALDPAPAEEAPREGKTER